MKKLLLLSFLLAIVLFGFQGAFAQSCTINTNVNGIGGTAIAGSGVAQSFTACASGKLNYVSVGVTNTASASVYVEIFTGEGYGTKLGTSGFFSLHLNGTNRLDLSALNINVVSGQKYTAKFYGSASFQYGTYALADYYPGGRILEYGAANNDLFFTAQILTLPAPTLLPETSSQSVAKSDTFKIQFDRAMQAGSGNIEVRTVTGNSLVTSLTASSLIYSGNSVSFVLSNVLDDTTNYNIVVPSGVLKTTTGINYTGISSDAWTFKTRLGAYVVLSFNDLNATNNSPFTIDVIFDRKMLGLLASDFTVENGTASNLLGQDSLYTLDITPIAEGIVTVRLPKDSVETIDAIKNEASNTLKIDYEAGAPTVTLTATIGYTTSKGINDVLISFSEKMQTLESTDISLTNASISKLTKLNDSTYRAAVEATAAGLVEVSLIENAAMDLAGNGSEASDTISYYFVPDIRANQIVYYPFDGNTNDLSGAGANLTVSASEYGLDRYGRADSAFVFGNVDSSRGINNTSDGLDGFSVSVWINPTTTLTDGASTLVLYEFYQRSLLRYQGSNLRFDIADANDANYYYLVDTTLSAGTWYHIVVSVDAGGLTRIFLNNNEVASGNSPANVKTGSQTLNVGKGAFTGAFAYRFPAAMDDFRLYSKPLSASEIATIYNDEQIIYQSKAVSVCSGETYEVSDITFESAGNYSYLIDGGAEADTLVSMAFSIDALPSVYALSTSQSICEGDEVAVYGSGADSYTWDQNIVDNVSFQPLSTSTYTVTGLDSATMCSNTAQVAVSVITNIVLDEALTAGQTLLCAIGDSTTISTSGSVNGVKYFLRNNEDNSILDGPKIGDGNPITFNTGAITDTTLYEVFGQAVDENPVPGGALDFDGANDKVTIPYSASMALSNAFTIEAWVYPRATNYTRIFTNFGGAAGVRGDILVDLVGASIQNGRGLRFYIVKSSSIGFFISVDNVVTLNEWNHVAATFDNGSMKLFVNGIEVKSGSLGETSIIPSTTSWTLGEDRGGTVNEYFNGKMDEVRIWNVAKTGNELLAAKDDCLSGEENGLVIYYKFDEVTGSTTLTDDSGNNNTGTLLNMDAASDWVTGQVACSEGCSRIMSDIITVSVGDVELPVAIAQDITVELSANGEATLTAVEVNNGSEDNCTASESLLLELDKTIFTCDDLGDQIVTLKVTDLGGNESSITATITVVDVTAPTVLTSDITVILDENGAASITEADIDNGSSDQCSAVSLSLDIFSFDISNIGENSVTLTVTDLSGNQASGTAIVTIVPLNMAPVIDEPLTEFSFNEDAGQVIMISDLSATFSDPDQDVLTYSVISDQVEIIATVLESSGIYSVVLTTAENYFGSGNVTVSASDGVISTDMLVVITVEAVNDQPLFSLSGDVTALEDFQETLSVSPELIQPENESNQILTYSLSPKSVSFANISFDTNTGLFEVSSLENTYGSQEFTISVNDGESINNTYEATFLLTITSVDDAPVLSTVLPNLQADEDALLHGIDLTEFFTEVDGESLTFTYQVTKNLSLLEIQLSETGQMILSAFPDRNGSATVQVTAMDTQENSINTTFEVLVNPVNDAPEFSLSTESLLLMKNFTSTETISVTPEAVVFGEESQVPHYYLSPESVDFANVTINATTGEITITSIANAAGSQAFIVLADDEQDFYNTAERTFTLTVLDNLPPVIIAPISDVTITEDAATTSMVTDVSGVFSDPEGDALTYTLSHELGNSVTIALVGNEIQATPSPNFFGSGIVSVTASDAEHSVTETFLLTVIPINDAPILQNPIADVTIVQDVQFVLSLPTDQFFDVEGTSLAISVNFSATWLEYIEGIEGGLSSLMGTPGAGDVGDYVVTIIAFDGELSVFDEFMISVLSNNQAPTEILLTGTQVQENQTGIQMVGELTTNDPDQNDFHIYQLVSSSESNLDNPLFEITQGVEFGTFLTFIGEADFETKSSYDVRVRSTDSKGLFVEQSFTISVIDSEEPIDPLGFEEVSVEIYPNPVHDYLTIKSQELMSIELIELTGVIIKKGTSGNRMDLKELSQGVYLIRLTNGSGQSMTHRLIKN